MPYFAAISTMENLELNEKYRTQHVEYLNNLGKQGKIFAKGPFTDRTGGLVVYRAESLEEARRMAENDPFVIHGARSFRIHEWDLRM